MFFQCLDDFAGEDACDSVNFLITDSEGNCWHFSVVKFLRLRRPNIIILDFSRELAGEMGRDWGGGLLNTHFNCPVLNIISWSLRCGGRVRGTAVPVVEPTNH
jgi:hypothetical protein